MAASTDNRFAALKARVTAHGHELAASDGVRGPVTYSILDAGARAMTGVVGGTLDDVETWLVGRELVELEHRINDEVGDALRTLEVSDLHLLPNAKAVLPSVLELAQQLSARLNELCGTEHVRAAERTR